jgi:putative ABC transport system permease protein
VIALIRYSAHWILHEFWRAAFTVFGVALGVSVFVATLVAQSSMQESFKTAVEGFSGIGWWEVLAKSNGLKQDLPFSEAIVPHLLRANSQWPIVPELSVPTSIVCQKKTANKTTQLRVIHKGVDALSMPLYFKPAMTDRWALSELTTLLDEQRSVSPDIQLKDCHSLSFGEEALSLSPAHQSPGNTEFPTLLSDISWVQDRYNLAGFVTRVLVRPSGYTEEHALERLAEEMHLVAQPIAERVNSLQDVTRAFRVNILFLSACSLVVATYLLHSLLTFWCIKRRDDGRLLRSIGVTPRQMYWMVVLEALAISLCGSALGLVFGWLVGGALLSAVTETVSILYTRIPLGAPILEFSTLLPLVVAGLLVGFLSSHAQAKELSMVVVQSMRQQPAKERSSRLVLAQIAIGCLFFGLSTAAAFRLLKYGSGEPSIELWIGLAVPLLYLVGILCLVSPSVSLVLGFLSSIQHRLRPSSILALEHMNSAFQRTVGAVSALVVSAGLFVGINCMIVSFSSSLETWLKQILKADIYISIKTESLQGTGALDASYFSLVRTLPEVRSIDSVRTLHATHQGRPYQLSGVSLDVAEKENRLVFLSGGFPILANHQVFVSEPFARWHDITVGEKLALAFGDSPISVEVRGVFKDYSTESGVVLANDDLIKSLPGVPSPHGMSLYLKEHVSVPDVLGKLQGIFQGANVDIRSQKGLRKEVFRIFRSTFKVTHLLMWVTFAASIFVVINSIILMVTERRLELDGLRAMGASRSVIQRMLAFEAFFLGLVGCLGALICGLGLAEILVRFINPFFFGWSITPSYTSGLPFLILLAIPFVTWMAGYGVAGCMFRGRARGIRYE